jgi:hypothetical protein
VKSWLRYSALKEEENNLTHKKKLMHEALIEKWCAKTNADHHHHHHLYMLTKSIQFFDSE